MTLLCVILSVQALAQPTPITIHLDSAMNPLLTDLRVKIRVPQYQALQTLYIECTFDTGENEDGFICVPIPPAQATDTTIALPRSFEKYIVRVFTVINGDTIFSEKKQVTSKGMASLFSHQLPSFSDWDYAQLYHDKDGMLRVSRIESGIKVHPDSSTKENNCMYIWSAMHYTDRLKPFFKFKDGNSGLIRTIKSVSDSVETILLKGYWPDTSLRWENVFCKASRLDCIGIFPADSGFLSLQVMTSVPIHPTDKSLQQEMEHIIFNPMTGQIRSHHIAPTSPEPVDSLLRIAHYGAVDGMITIKQSQSRPFRQKVSLYIQDKKIWEVSDVLSCQEKVLKVRRSIHGNYLVASIDNKGPLYAGKEVLILKEYSRNDGTLLLDCQMLLRYHSGPLFELHDMEQSPDGCIYLIGTHQGVEASLPSLIKIKPTGTNAAGTILWSRTLYDFEPSYNIKIVKLRIPAPGELILTGYGRVGTQIVKPSLWLSRFLE